MIIKTVEQYKARLDHYLKEVLADEIYFNRANRSKLKELVSVLVAKALRRPRVQSNLITPPQRNLIEGKFDEPKQPVEVEKMVIKQAFYLFSRPLIVIEEPKVKLQVIACYLKSNSSFGNTSNTSASFER